MKLPKHIEITAVEYRDDVGMVILYRRIGWWRRAWRKLWR